MFFVFLLMILAAKLVNVFQNGELFVQKTLKSFPF